MMNKTKLKEAIASWERFAKVQFEKGEFNNFELAMHRVYGMKEVLEG